MKKLTILGLVALLVASAVTAAVASQQTPMPFQMKTKNSVDPFWDGLSPLTKGVPLFNKEGNLADTVWVRVKDDSSCSYTGSGLFGSRGVRAPSWAYWCFDAGAGDSCSNTTKYGANTASNRIPGCWTHYDAHIFGAENKWHIATYDVYLPGSEDSSMWCGEIRDTLIWQEATGYGRGYNYSLILNLGNQAAFSTANGMTLGGVHIFAIELAYDYCFVEMSASGIADTAIWLEIGRYNGISNPDSANCRGLGGSLWGDGAGGNAADKPYLCADWVEFNIPVSTAQLTLLAQDASENLFVRWRVVADQFWDDETGGDGTEWDTRGAWRVDHLFAKGANNGGSFYFPAGGAGSRDPNSAAGNVDWETLAEDGRSAFSTLLLPRAEQSGGYWNTSSWVHGKPAIVDLWHLTNTPTYPNQGQTCETTNRWLWASNLTPGGVDGNIESNGWLMRLASPTFDLTPTSILTAGSTLAGSRVSGFMMTYDDYLCTKQTSSDVCGFVAQTYEGAPQNAWNTWDAAGYFFLGCQAFFLQDSDNWSTSLTATTDSIRTGYDMWDQCDYNSGQVESCMPGIFVTNPHRKNTFIFDNFSAALFSQTSTAWAVGTFQDTFEKGVYLHPVSKENWELFPADPREPEDSLNVTVIDLDGMVENSIVMHYRVSTTCGATWTHESSRPQGSKAKPAIEWFTKVMNFSDPDDNAEPNTPTEFNGTYGTTLELDVTDLPGDILSAGELRAGTVVEYYFTGTDNSATPDTVPNRSAERRTFIHPAYGTERQDAWPLEVTVLPCRPSTDYTAQGGKKLLLFNDVLNGNAYDSESDPTLAVTTLSAATTVTFPRISQLYEEALRDLNLKFDRYDNIASFFVRGAAPLLPFYVEPTDLDGSGGIRDPNTATHRYQDVIWASGNSRVAVVYDSSQIELANYLASDVNEGNVWLAGHNLCEDEVMTGISEAFQAGTFWINYVGAALVSGGCADNSGIADRKFYIEGVNDADFTPFTLVGGWADCPIRDQPDNQLALNAAGQGTEVVIFQFDNLAHTLNEEAGILNTQPGAPNKMITTMFGLSDVTTRAARACLTRAILTEFGMTMPAGSKYTSAICANSATDIGGTGGARKFDLEQNYPNPFNPSTKIRYALPKDNMKVQLSIFDVSGRQVVTLVNRIESGAQHEVLWNGKNAAGQDVASGVYFYKLKADNQEAVKKMVLLK